ncbi:hypothetical protein [Enterovibrio norvegicus]|uniref:Uncharacterized protein n=1 Tax=Enterovibrio norvegicus TaxID=188144 RepID=A0ABV4KZR4_9GAMM|nr:hypothetical protein [Enterovibrio norvegicus]
MSYWLAYYDMEDSLTDKQRLQATSADIDYCGTKQDFERCSETWNVKFDIPSMSDATPEIGHSVLRDKITSEVKEHNGSLFVDIIAWEENKSPEPNVVDVLRLPAGFDRIDFENKRLEQHSSLFEFPPEFELKLHSKLRILNPIGCLKSRLLNYQLLSRVKDPTREVTRIKLLVQPVLYFLTEQLIDNGYREARKYIELYMILIKSFASMKLLVSEGVDLSLGISFFVEENKDRLPYDFVINEFPRWKSGLEEKIERKRKQYES